MSWMPDPAFSFETSRLVISHLNPDDEAHCQFLCDLYEIPTLEGAKKFINGRIKFLFSTFGFGIYLVSLKDSTPIGTIGLSQGNVDESFPAPDIGYAILPSVRGCGYATEAAQGLLDYAAKELGVKDVFGFCDAGNAKSKAVMERLGMEPRGVVKLRMFGGEPSAVYVLRGMKGLVDYGIGDKQIAE